jgi:ATP-dependent DNA helicase RecG
LIVEMARVLESQLREFSRLGEDGKFYTAPEYPADAWYEAIVNACVHRSYGLKNIPIFVKMYDDRLVVESPGAFPPFVTPKNIYNVHHPRNPHLMKSMFYLDFVKCHNEGTRRMRDTMEEMKLPRPEFYQSQEASGSKTVRVTLRNNRKQRKVWIDSAIIDLLPLEIAKTLNQHETSVVNFIGEHGKINVTQCQKLLNKRWHAAKKLLMNLCKREILIHVHSKTIVRDFKACFKIRPRIALNGK